jgi:hypothetical protein
MSHRYRYREHEVRIRGSLERVVGEAATLPADLHRLVDRARRAGVTVFLREDLERLPDLSRALIESEHRRIEWRRLPRTRRLHAIVEKYVPRGLAVSRETKGSLSQ